MTFYYCWGVKSSSKLVWVESTSRCNSLIGHLLKCSAAHWSDPYLFWKKPVLTLYRKRSLTVAAGGGGGGVGPKSHDSKNGGTLHFTPSIHPCTLSVKIVQHAETFFFSVFSLSNVQEAPWCKQQKTSNPHISLFLQCSVSSQVIKFEKDCIFSKSKRDEGIRF